MNEVIEAGSPSGTVSVAAQTSDTVMQIIASVMNRPDFDVAKVQALLELKERYDANEARKAYVADMALFKQEPIRIDKDKEVRFTNTDGSTTGYNHATLGNVTEKIVHGLALHGFSHRWVVKQGDGRVVVTCVVTHKLGHSESTVMDASPDGTGKKNSIQQVASAITYLQRYTLLAATGLATNDMPDDDGAAAGDPVSEVPEPSKELLDEAKKTAECGVKVYESFWRGIGKERRHLLGAYHDQLKKNAANADAAKVPAQP